MFRNFDFALVDAFSDKSLMGNPCAIILNAEGLNEETMLAIAKEMNQSETAFITKLSENKLGARFFTPEREIPLAGHPTIAGVHAAFEFQLVKSELSKINLELIEGPILVEILPQVNKKRLIRMFQRKPIFGETHDPDVIMPLFGLTKNDLMPDCQIQTVSTGTKQLMVPLKSLSTLEKIKLNITAYKEYRSTANFFSPHLFCLQGVMPDEHTFARHPGVPPDTCEDAFTGSATGAMGAYLWKYNLINSPYFTAGQGHWMGRPGKAYVEIHGPRENIEYVSVAGHATIVVRGIFTLSI